MKRLKIDDEDALVALLKIDEEQLRAQVSAYTDRIKEINTLLAQADFKKLPDAAELVEKIEALVEKVNELEVELSAINDQLAVVERINEGLKSAQIGIGAALDENDKFFFTVDQQKSVALSGDDKYLYEWGQ
jgi:seryl-tRNA synthetase